MQCNHVMYFVCVYVCVCVYECCIRFIAVVLVRAAV